MDGEPRQQEPQEHPQRGSEQPCVQRPPAPQEDLQAGEGAVSGSAPGELTPPREQLFPTCLSVTPSCAAGEAAWRGTSYFLLLIPPSPANRGARWAGCTLPGRPDKGNAFPAICRRGEITRAASGFPLSSVGRKTTGASPRVCGVPLSLRAELQKLRSTC